MSRRGLARYAGVAVRALGLAVVSALGCVGVLDLQGYESAPVALCELLDCCYGRAGLSGCLEHVEARLDAAEDASSAAWLTVFADEQCADDCQSALTCLDTAPVCGGVRAPCAADEQCCGFTTGVGACKGQRCCGPEGVSCLADADCCEGACDAGTQTCGGVVCALPGTACTNDFECCTQLCDQASGTCAQTVCDELGFACTESKSCCSQFCDAGGQCAPPPCTPQGGPCSADVECCTNVCYEVLGVCSVAECAPDEVPCLVDAECCSGFCDPLFFLCGAESQCAQPGEECQVVEQCCSFNCTEGRCDCVADGQPCFDITQCCSQSCNEGSCGGGQTCSAPSEPCTLDAECCSGRCGTVDPPGCCAHPSCGHGVCEVGTPLDGFTCTEDCPACNGACVSAICEADPFCCCTGWDSICVAAVPQLCGIVCTENN